MGSFLQNLTEGLANAAGDQNSVNQFEAKKADRRATSREELQSNTQSILNDVKMLQERRQKLDPQSPTYQKDISEIDAGLHAARQQFYDLYHPQKNPGALAHFGGFLKEHLTGQGPQAPVANRGEALERLDAISAGGGTTDPNALSPEDQKKAARIAAGLDPRATAEKPEKFQGQLTETTDAQGQKHYWRVPLEPGGKPEEVDFQGQKVTPKGANAAPKVGSFGDFMVASYGPHPTPQQYEQGRKLWAQSGAGTTVGEHVVMVPQPDGSIKAVTVVTTSTKSFGGGQPGAIPKTAGAAKAMVKPPSAGVASVGETVGGKMTAPQSKAQTVRNEAAKLSSLADQVAQHPDDAVTVKGFAIALETARAHRFTSAALDTMLQAGWANKLEQWANNPTTGTLPKDILRQLVDGAHQNLKASQDALDVAMKPMGGGTAPNSAPSAAPQKIVVTPEDMK